MKKEYRNVTRSKNALRTALISLVNKKASIDVISVSDLCNEACVNRGTFYNHYSSIIDLVHDMENVYFELIEQTLNETGFDSKEKRHLFYAKINKILEDNHDVGTAVVKALPNDFRYDGQQRIAEIHKKYFAENFPEIAKNARLMNEIEMVSVGIASSYSLVVAGCSKLVAEEVGEAAASLFDSILEHY